MLLTPHLYPAQHRRAYKFAEVDHLRYSPREEEFCANKACALELPQPAANSPPYNLQQRTPLHSTAFRNPLPQSRNSAAHYNTTPNYRNLETKPLRPFPLQARLRINYTTRRERRNKHRLQKIRILTAHHNVAGLSEVQVLEAKSIFAEAKRRQIFPRAQSALSKALCTA